MSKPYKFKFWHIIFLVLLPFVPIYFIFKSEKLESTAKWMISIFYVVLLLILSLFVPKLESIEVAANKVSFFKDETGELSITFNPVDQGDLDLLTCTSSDSNIISISELSFTAKDEGTVTIKCTQEEIVSNEITIEVKLTEEQKIEKRINALIEKTGDIGYSKLLSADVNYPIELIEDIAKVYEKFELGNIRTAGTIVEENGRQMTGIFTEKNGAFKIYVHNNKMESMEDMKGEVIYLVGNVANTYILQTDVERKLSLIYSDVKKEVKKGLLYPKTAEFIDPNGIEDSSWTFFWKHGYLSVASFVRSENVFGNDVIKPFLVQFVFIQDVFVPTYVGIDDLWSEGDYVEHTE